MNKIRILRPDFFKSAYGFWRNEKRWRNKYPSLKNEIVGGYYVKKGDKEITEVLEGGDYLGGDVLNLGSASKVFGVDLAINTLKDNKGKLSSREFDITFDEFIEAVWRRQLKHLLDSPFYKEVFEKFDLEKELIDKIIKDSLLVQQIPKEFDKTILQKIKDGLFEKYRDVYPQVKVDFREVCFLVLTVSSNSSYNQLCKKIVMKKLFTKEEFITPNNFEFIDPRKKFSQKLPNASKLSDSVKAFEKLVKEWLSKPKNSYQKFALQSIFDTDTYHEFGVTGVFKDLQKKGRINSKLHIVEKPGTSLPIMWGKDLIKVGLPCHITFCTLFTVLDEDMKIIYSAGYFKTIAVKIKDILLHHKSYAKLLREVKEMYSDEYKRGARELIFSNYSAQPT